MPSFVFPDVWAEAENLFEEIAAVLFTGNFWPAGLAESCSIREQCECNTRSVSLALFRKCPEINGAGEANRTLVIITSGPALGSFADWLREREIVSGELSLQVEPPSACVGFDGLMGSRWK